MGVITRVIESRGLKIIDHVRAENGWYKVDTYDSKTGEARGIRWLRYGADGHWDVRRELGQ